MNIGLFRYFSHSLSKTSLDRGLAFPACSPFAAAFPSAAGPSEEIHLHSEVPLARLPRQLTLLARLGVLFGGVMALIGSVLFGFGMVFFWIFVMNSELAYLGSEARAWQAYPGRIVLVEATGASENDEEVVRYLYEYEVGGELHAGRGYTTDWRWEEGQAVQIDLGPDEPEVSRLPGTRRAMFGPAAAIAGIFPLIGAVVLVVTLHNNRRHLRLLADGQLAQGRVVGREPTGTIVNNQRVYRYSIEYQDAGGRSHTLTTRTHLADRVEDQPSEALLYDPEDPASGVLLDALPLLPTPGPDGVLRIGPGGALRTLLVPALCLLPHLAWAIWRYGLR
jgi:hypothetical protein